MIEKLNDKNVIKNKNENHLRSFIICYKIDTKCGFYVKSKLFDET